MLVLSRSKGQEIVLGDPPNEIRLTVVEIRPDKVRLGITAPREVPVRRGEVCDNHIARREATR